MIKAEIRIPKDMIKSLKPEAYSSPRSEVIVNEKITITAKDAVAFRASMNAITTAMAVYDKMRDLK